ncbi:hypothetical protein [Streptomyces sp. I6]|uniref:hypothetical protein n=1 Tax=Streptomyces sp. I6 TaxID=2483113 RepID=UPI002880AC90|nr:hypothetical protein [Streptomyces sp. I6]
MDHQPSVIESPWTSQRGRRGAGTTRPPTPRTPRTTGAWDSGGWTVNGPGPGGRGMVTTASSAGSVNDSAAQRPPCHSAKQCARSRSASVGRGTLAR